jgi:long-chain acyl-CoA synthetase
MQDVQTVNGAFLAMTDRGEKTAWLYQEASGAWNPISAAEAYRRVRAFAAVLSGWGIGKGDRVALLSENRWEWPVVDFAVLALGAVDVPLYMTLTPEQIGYMLRDSAAKVVAVSTREQYDKLCAAGELPALEHVVVMEQGNFPNAESFSSLVARAGEIQIPDAAFNEQSQSVQPSDLATIIYTSGTTGEPKGVMLTHGNLTSNFTLSTAPFGFGEKDSCISFLPLSHVTARHLDYALMLQGVTVAYCPKIDALRHAMQAVRPTIFVGVPRVFEKIRQGVEGKSHGTKKRILNWALNVGKAHRTQTAAGKTPSAISWRLADKLVFSKIHEAFGGRVGTFVSGGAPLGIDTAGWFADVGIRILEGYGLTETSPVISLNTRERYRIGSVGPVLKNVEVRLAEDGELEVRGPSVFQGYWNKPHETAEAFTPDGWLRTGDIASMDQDGFLYITDRKKELLKTSGGKLIAPQPIENKLKAHALVANAALVGDKHKFACVLISPNFATLEGWAKIKGVDFTDRQQLVSIEQVIARYRRIVDEVNATLAPFETIKRLAVVPEEWSIETGELTPSMKLKRRVVEQQYARQIAGFYKDEATSTR